MHWTSALNLEWIKSGRSHQEKSQLQHHLASLKDEVIDAGLCMRAVVVASEYVRIKH